LLSKIQAMYSKGGGKYGKHNNIDDHANLSGISNLGVQVYEPFQGGQFRTIMEATASLQTKHFRLLAPFTFLYRLSAPPKLTPTGIELTASDLTIFRDLSRNIKSLDAAVKQSKSRKEKGGAVKEDDAEDTTIEYLGATF
ncbi:hypothetical protein B0H14DRAFT_2355020, partial [Mycena olivaceomarginata]